MAMAQNDQVKGVINGRSGATMTELSQGGDVNSGHASVRTRRAFSEKAPEHDRTGAGTGSGSERAFNDKHQLVADQVTFHVGALKPRKTYMRGWL